MRIRIKRKKRRMMITIKMIQRMIVTMIPMRMM